MDKLCTLFGSCCAYTADICLGISQANAPAEYFVHLPITDILFSEASFVSVNELTLLTVSILDPLYRSC